MRKVTYRELAPPAELKRLAEGFWITEALHNVSHSVPPDGCVDIVYSPEMGLRAVGAMTVAQSFAMHGGTRTVGVRFRPGMARQILRLPLVNLSDSSVLLEQLWGRRGRELSDQLAGADSAAESLAVMRQAVDRSDAEANSVQRAIGYMASVQGRVNLDHLACEANLSSRQFRRRCLEESGLTPKRLSRILRLRHAEMLARREPHPNWAEIAAEAGYFDQAHLIRDFREFLRQTPVSVLSNPAF